MAIAATLGGKARTGAGVIVAVCLAIAAIEGYDIQAFGIAAPKLGPEFGLSPGEQGWAASAALIGLVLGAFCGGWFADRVGRKPVLAGAVAVFGLFSLATAFTDTYPMLLAARFLAGLGFGAAMPNLIAIATEISAPGRRSLTVTAMFCGMPVGGAVVSTVARLAGPGLEWRQIFIAGGLIPLMLFPVVLWLLPETRPQPDVTADRRMVTALFAEGRTGATLILWLALLLTLGITFLILNWLPTLMVARGFSAADGFAASMAFNAAGAAGALAAGLLLDRIGYRWAIPITYLGLALALVALSTAGDPTLAIALSGSVGFLVLAAQFGLYAVTPTFYPAAARAGAAGAAIAVGRIGSIAGPLVAGALRDGGHSAGEVFATMAPAGFAAGLAVLVLGWMAPKAH